MNLKNSLFGLTSPSWDHLFPVHARNYEWNATPAADLVEEDNAWIFRVDMPGVGKDNVDVEINGNQLLIAGKRQISDEQQHRGYSYLERMESQFKRVFVLPDTADRESINATIKNGVVEVRVEKIPAIQTKKISVVEHQS